jgi:hypothetical protein
MKAKVTHSISYSKDNEPKKGYIYMKESNDLLVMVTSVVDGFNLVCLNKDVGNSWNGIMSKEEVKKEIEKEGFILIKDCNINITN